MSGIISDVSTVFSNVGDTVAGWFGSGASDAATSAIDSSVNAMSSAAGDAAQSAATDAAASAASSYLGDAASAASSGMSDAIDVAAGAAATASDSTLSNLYQSLDSAAAASYTAGTTTGDWTTAVNPNDFAISPSSTQLNIDTSSLTSPYTSAAVGLQSGQQSWLGRMTDGVKSFFTGGGEAGTGSGGGSSDFASKMLLGDLLGRVAGTAISAYGAYKMNLPRAPANYSGRTPGGGGGGLGMHTGANGFGLIAGGSQAPATGVPNQLMPNAQAEQLGGSGGLARSAPPVAGSPNLQQTVANQAGVGALIPQGSVNFMQGPGHG